MRFVRFVEHSAPPGAPPPSCPGRRCLAGDMRDDLQPRQGDGVGWPKSVSLRDAVSAVTTCCDSAGKRPLVCAPCTDRTCVSSTPRRLPAWAMASSASATLRLQFGGAEHRPDGASLPEELSEFSSVASVPAATRCCHLRRRRRETRTHRLSGSAAPAARSTSSRAGAEKPEQAPHCADIDRCPAAPHDGSPACAITAVTRRTKARIGGGLICASVGGGVRAPGECFGAARLAPRRDRPWHAWRIEHLTGRRTAGAHQRYALAVVGGGAGVGTGRCLVESHAPCPNSADRGTVLWPRNCAAAR